MANNGSLLTGNKLWKVILGDELFRAPHHERREPAECPHTENIRGQQRALRIQARLVISLRFGTELGAQTLKSKRNDAEPAYGPSRRKDGRTPRVRDEKGGAGRD